ncbi:hypothetical protein CEV32_1234 [Brucella rhizosphaerae]|uniref:Uncharacterized protein n=1 Tax=Brucella rhizosphaerae TaxID=571254 RepID=A0A256FBC1_9HYPH|nr:hypothetical protein CEV32_1234 [Brucella rhizosphaerae]
MTDIALNDRFHRAAINNTSVPSTLTVAIGSGVGLQVLFEAA